MQDILTCVMGLDVHRDIIVTCQGVQRRNFPTFWIFCFIKITP